MWNSSIFHKKNISKFKDENAFKNRLSSTEIWKVGWNFKAADKNHHTFLSNKTDVNKRSFKMDW